MIADRIARPFRLLVACLALSLAGACSTPDFRDSPNAAHALPPPESSPATLAKDVLIADDGTRLPLRIWRPHGEVHAVVIALHGFNDYSEAYAAPADVWAHYGIITYAYDQRGFGANKDPGIWPGARTLCHDLATAVRVVRARHPDLPVYVVGESMGAAVILDSLGGADASAPKPDGVILVSPAVWARETMPLINRIALWVGARIIPDITFTGKGMGVLASDNFPMLRRLSRDPLFIKNTRVDAIYGLVDLMDQALAAGPKLKEPALVLIGAHDEIVPPEPLHDLVNTLPGLRTGDDRIAYYPDGWHMLLRDIEGPIVAEDVAAWIYDHAAPLPSGADDNAALFFDGKKPAPSMSASR
ncbi:MAG TPA: alpha/beta hydrolase [Aliidongia sp.]|nr:alpha/beta hydrolase [Aliidongia sp.]